MSRPIAASSGFLCVAPCEPSRNAPRYTYVVAVSARHRDDLRRGLALSFPHLVDTVARDVFVVETHLSEAAVRPVFADVAAGCREPVTVRFVEEIDWQVFGRGMSFVPAA